MTDKLLNIRSDLKIKDLSNLDDGFILESCDINNIFDWSVSKGFFDNNIFEQYAKVLEEVSEFVLSQEELLSLSLKPNVLNPLVDCISLSECYDVDVYSDLLDSVGDILISLMVLYQQITYESNDLNTDVYALRPDFLVDMELVFSTVYGECMNICVNTLDEQDLMIDFLKDISFLSNDVFSKSATYVLSSIMSIYTSLFLISIYYGFTLKLAFDCSYEKLLECDHL